MWRPWPEQVWRMAVVAVGERSGLKNALNRGRGPTSTSGVQMGSTPSPGRREYLENLLLQGTVERGNRTLQVPSQRRPQGGIPGFMVRSSLCPSVHCGSVLPAHSPRAHVLCQPAGRPCG